MKVSNRQRRLLEVLLGRSEDVTAGQLAQEVRISARTVYRELQELTPMLETCGISLVKRSGVGISLDGDEAGLLRLQEQLRLSETEAYSPDERKVLMLCRLLENDEPVKLFTLAREVQAAIPTVSRDLDECAPLLARGGLALVRRRGYGVEIVGTESARRACLVLIAEAALDPSDLFGIPSQAPDPWPVRRRLLDIVGQSALLQIEQPLWALSEDWLGSLKDTDYHRLLLRLSVAFTRIRQGYVLEKRRPAAAGSPEVYPTDVADRLASALDIELPRAEAEAMQALIEETKERAADVSSVILQKYGLDLADQAFGLVRAMQDRMAFPFADDRSLLDGLIRHLGPALDRYRRGDPIRNPLLPQVRKDYEDVYDAVRRCADGIWRQPPLPDEEIGYLVMHFGAAMERRQLTPGQVKALLVCTSGIGSSKLLAVRITKEIPQVEIVDNCSWYEALRIPEERYDLIISTVDLPIDPGRYVKLSPLLSREEAERLRSRLREMAAGGQTSAGLPVGAAGNPREGPESREAGAWDRFRRLHAYASEILDVLEPFRVYEWDKGREQGDALHLLLNMLADLVDGDAIMEREQIAGQLMERERQGSLRIPDSELALFHARSPYVRKPVLALFRFGDVWRAPEEGSAPIRQALLMLAPEKLNKQTLELLSEISAMLLLPEMVRELEEGDEDRIRSWIAWQLETYIKGKWDGRDAR